MATNIRSATYGGVTYGGLYYAGYLSGECLRWIKQPRGESSFTRQERGASSWTDQGRGEVLLNLLTQDSLKLLTQDSNYIMIVQQDSMVQARGTSNFDKQERGASSWTRQRRPPCA